MMPQGYGSHKDYIDRVRISADARESGVQTALRKAFRRFIQERAVEVIVFSTLMFRIGCGLRPSTGSCLPPNPKTRSTTRSSYSFLCLRWQGHDVPDRPSFGPG